MKLRVGDVVCFIYDTVCYHKSRIEGGEYRRMMCNPTSGLAIVTSVHTNSKQTIITMIVSQYSQELVSYFTNGADYVDEYIKIIYSLCDHQHV